MKQTLFIRNSNDKPFKVSPVKLKQQMSSQYNAVRSPKVLKPAQILFKPDLSQTKKIVEKKLNKTLENLRQGECKKSSYSRQSSILSLEDLLLLGKELFSEQVQVKQFSKTPNITRSTANACIELKGTRTGTTKEYRSRPKSNRKFLKTTNIAMLSRIRPITVSRNLRTRNLTDTLSPWVDNNY